MKCSDGRGCDCRPEDPAITTPSYSRERRHPDAGDLDALERVTGWLLAGEPQCHLRYSDGEFMSMLGTDEPVNSDGQPHLTETLGRDLFRVLLDVALGAVEEKGNVLVGGDWRRPAETFDWLKRHGFLSSIPWCPSQVFVNGILSGHLMQFLHAVRHAPGQKFLVANERVASAVASSLGAHPIFVPEKGAYTAMDWVSVELLHKMRPGAIVLYAAGLGCKPTAWNLYRHAPGTSHIDVGCVFDGAAGLQSRSWLGGEPDAQLLEYRRSVVPWLLREGRA